MSEADVGKFSTTRDRVSWIHGLRLTWRFVWKVVVRNEKIVCLDIKCFRIIQRVLDYFKDAQETTI